MHSTHLSQPASICRPSACPHSDDRKLLSQNRQLSIPTARHPAGSAAFEPNHSCTANSSPGLVISLDSRGTERWSASLRRKAAARVQGSSRQWIFGPSRYVLLRTRFAAGTRDIGPHHRVSRVSWHPALTSPGIRWPSVGRRPQGSRSVPEYGLAGNALRSRSAPSGQLEWYLVTSGSLCRVLLMPRAANSTV